MINEFYLIFIFVVLANCTPLKPVDSTCGYASCPQTSLDDLNVHLIPHSHDDLGWLVTFDQYYFREVQNVIGSVIGALTANPNRTFIQVETGYLKKWWEQQSESTRETMRKLVDSGRLEIINGGFCMNDEATVNYQSTIDQYTLGFRFLEDNLGPCSRPKTGWQIDTFGHSREQASINAQLGFDSLFFMRLDYRDQQKRLAEKTADLMWQGSQNLESSNIFTSVFFRRTYAFPDGFCFDIVCQDEPLITDEDSPDYNYPKRVEEFAQFVRQQADSFATNNILVTMGDDVRYQASFTNYLNIDRLIRGFELFPQDYNGKPIKLHYSTPTCYTKSVHDFVDANNYQLDIKTDDFLPYATDGYGYWSGFYTARPATKKFERQGNNFLQISKQLAVLGGLQYDNNINALKEAMGVLQHHDAITGTEKQAVLSDYHRMLYAALEKAHQEVEPILSSAISTTIGESLQFETCLFSNISSCRPSSSSEFTVAIYNPLARVVSTPIELPVQFNSWSITDPTGQQVDYQISLPIIDFSYVTNVPTSQYSLTFTAIDLPPLGYKVYSFKTSTLKVPQKATYGNSNTNFEIDDATGLLKSITINGNTLEVSQDLFYYKSGDYSGAYIFVPSVNEKFRVAQDTVKVTSFEGPVFSGVIQEFSSWAKQIIKVYHNENNFIEIEWIVGPTPVTESNGEAVGKEVISHFMTPLKSASNFYTDSNGREMLKRTRNYRPTYEFTNEEPIAGNYHPITSRIVLKDEDVELAVLTDRSQGGTSLEDGSLELMIQRACPHNDFGVTRRGVGESIDDQEYGQGVVNRGKHYLVLGSTAGNGNMTTAAIQRKIAQEKLLQPWVFVTDLDTSGKINQPEFSLLQRTLPQNVHILTLEPWQDGVVLLRLEHILEKNEDEILSQKITVDLNNLFSIFEITELTEMTLGANNRIEDKVRLKWPGIKNDTPNEPIVDLKITLTPMQIRTFLAKIVYT